MKRQSVRSPMLAESPGTVLVVVAVVSLAAHGALAAWLLNKPMGRVSPEALSSNSHLVRIKRASYDRFVGEGEGLAAKDAASSSEPSSTALTEQILRQSDTALDHQALAADLEMPEPEESMPDLAETALDVSASEAWSEELLGEMPMRGPRELAFASSSQGKADAGSAGGLPSSRGAANNALAAALNQGLPGRRPVGGAADGPGASSGSGRGTGPGTGNGEAADGGVSQPLSAGDAAIALPGPGAGGGSGQPSIRDTGIDFTALADERRGGNLSSVEPKALDSDFNYKLTRFTRNHAGWFRVEMTPRRSLAELQTMAKDVVFVIDTSASVPQGWVKQAIRGVGQSLPSLNQGDRFNIVLFDANPKALSTDGIQKVTDKSLNDARKFLKGAKSKGMTDVNAALRRLLVRDLDTRRVYNIILISDGRPTRGVLDTRELLNLITRDNNLTAGIYCVGIGPKPNRELLNFLAYRNKGRAVYARDKKDAASKIRNLLSRLRYPLIKDVRLNVAGLDPKNNAQMYPRALPSIHQGERFSVFGRYDPATKARFTMRITGTSAGVPVDFTFPGQLTDAKPADRSLSKAWAFWKLHHLYTRILREGKRPELIEQVDALQRRYGLKTLY